MDSIKVKQSVTTKGSTTDAISHGHNGDYIYTRIPQGAYFTNASAGYPEIKTTISNLNNVLKESGVGSIVKHVNFSLDNTDLYFTQSDSKNVYAYIVGLCFIITLFTAMPKRLKFFMIIVLS